ncbi:unnamed protein product, partial [Prunus brigantina]
TSPTSPRPLINTWLRTRIEVRLKSLLILYSKFLSNPSHLLSLSLLHKAPAARFTP